MLLRRKASTVVRCVDERQENGKGFSESEGKPNARFSAKDSVEPRWNLTLSVLVYLDLYFKLGRKAQVDCILRGTNQWQITRAL